MFGVLLLSMKEDSSRSLLASRSRVLLILMIVFGGIFVARLFYVQIIQHGYYEEQALKEHARKFVITAKRGLIYTYDGPDKLTSLVLNEPSYTVYADPRYVSDADKIVDVMRRVAGGDLAQDFETGLRDKSRQYVVLANQINSTQADLIRGEKLKGVGLHEGEKRVYPDGQLAAHVLGFVDTEGNGQYGIEQGLNEVLAGEDGLLKAVTDVSGIPISVGSEATETPAKDGADVVLTIDRNIQFQAEKVLKEGLERVHATKGSILVMDPNNGHILGMANLPTYNPGDYAKTAAAGSWENFKNRVISEPYEPGSVIKPLTMGVGINEHVIDPDSTYNNTGYVQVDDARITNVLNYPQGSITMTQVLLYSFNTGAVHVLNQLGGGEINYAARQKLYGYFTDHYLFGKLTGIELAGETPGVVISPDNPNGGSVCYANMTFGQGMDASMIQVASAFSALINGGNYYRPQVVGGYRQADGSVEEKSPTITKSGAVSKETSDKVRSMLHEIRVKGPVGSSDKSGYIIGGKTGTAQVYDPETGKYSEDQTIGTYLGFGGQDSSRYVIMVRVDDSKAGGYAGSTAAAPIFNDLSNWLIDYMQIQPRG